MAATGNVGVAFALVVAGGGATALGALIVFCIKLATPRLLAASLGFAGGVMLYVCFAEIFMRKSVSAFEDLSLSGDMAYLYSTLCFFGGMLLIAILDQVVHAMVSKSDAITKFLASPVRGIMRTLSRRRLARAAGEAASEDGSVGDSSSVGRGVPKSPTRQQQWQQGKAGAAGGQQWPEQQRQRQVTFAEGKPPQQQGQGQQQEGQLSEDLERGGSSAGDLELGCCAESSCCDCPLQELPGTGRGQAGLVVVPEGAAEVLEVLKSDPHALALQKMGILTALAMGIHNFPEGLATFVGALSDVKVGAGIATAIAIHNIPEGICVAMPIFYATGSKWKAFLWAAIPGLMEPLGGVIGYVALHGNNDLAFAIVFGLVAGMMVFISIKELIPAAYRYDPEDRVTSTSVIIGMAVMAASLLLFLL